MRQTKTKSLKLKLKNIGLIYSMSIYNIFIESEDILMSLINLIDLCYNIKNKYNKKIKNYKILKTLKKSKIIKKIKNIKYLKNHKKTYHNRKKLIFGILINFLIIIHIYLVYRYKRNRRQSDE